MSAEKEWTVMVYLAGDNNLDAFGVMDLGEMKRAGSSDAVNVLAQFDRSGTVKHTKRYLLTKGGMLEKDEVADLGETNMGSSAVLTDFLRWGLKSFPSKRTMVVLWNHGAGWDDTDIYRTAQRELDGKITRRGRVLSEGGQAGSVQIDQVRAVGRKRGRRALFSSTVVTAMSDRAIAFDDQAQDFLDNLELKRVLRKVTKALGRKIDILGMDACLMNMLEVDYQVRESAAYTIGSEETEPGQGWPYDAILKDLVSKPQMAPADLATNVVKRYLGSYGADSSVTQSACDLGKIDPLAKAADTLARRLTPLLADPASRSAIVEARMSTQSYEVPEYIDFLDFCNLLASRTSSPAVVEACAAVKEAITAPPFVLRSGHKGDGLKNSNGVSIYFPQPASSSKPPVSPLYATLDFAKKTRWGTFLHAYADSVRRR